MDQLYGMAYIKSQKQHTHLVEKKCFKNRVE